MSEEEDKGGFKLLELAKQFWAALLLIGFVILVLGLLPGFSLGEFKTSALDPQGRYTAICAGLVFMGLGVIAGFRERHEGLSDKEAKGYGVEITAPAPPEVKADFKISGNYKKLPKQVQMAILEMGGGRYWRKCGVSNFDEKKKTWKSDFIHFKNEGREREFLVVVMLAVDERHKIGPCGWA